MTATIILSWCKAASRWLKRKKEKYIDHPRFERRMRKQRAERGFSEKDTWDVDDWLTTVLPSMIEEFYKNLHTTPLETEAFLKGADPFKFKYTSDLEITPELSDAMDRWWENHLREIAFHLREANYGTCSLRNKFEEENHWTPEYEVKISRYRHKQFQKAMNMLALVFGTLND